ncbi:MAG TPA: outer membrane protein assembly factor BamD [Nitrospiria bacterium]
MILKPAASQWMALFGMALLLSGGGGCATAEDPLGADIRKTLGVNKNTADETKDAIERNYDPKVILKRAEALYQRQEFIEAGAEYQHFLDLHPLHEWADYAQLKLGLSHYRQFVSIDRDPEPVQKALESFKKLLSTYPATSYAGEADKYIAASRERLAQQQFYVGHFYYKQGAYPAAIHRFQQILGSYSDQPVMPGALYYLALSYAGEGQPDQAAASLNDLIAKFPDSPYRTKARELLARFNVKPHS